MTTFISKKSWGSFNIKGDKVKPFRKKAANKSQEIQWRKSKKKRAVSPTKARGMQRP